MGTLLVALLFGAAVEPSSRPADEAVRAYLQTCGHIEGPVRFTTSDGGDKPRVAYACTSKGKTRVAVFSPLPSGQLGRQCDSAPVPGTAHKLAHVRTGGVDALYVKIVSQTPDEERVVEQALIVRWGACKVLAQSDITHPTDGLVLREPRGGLEIDDEGIDAWIEVARLRFGPDQRKIAVAMRGLRVEPQANEGRGQTEIEAEPVEPVFVHATVRKDGQPGPALADGSLRPFKLGPGDHIGLSCERSLIRGVRVRLTGDFLWPFSVHVPNAPVQEWRSDSAQWRSSPGVFGAGFLSGKGPTLSREVVVFFEPPVEAQELELALGPGQGEPLDVESVRVFRDAKDWLPFEESEDFGETERAY